MRVKLTSNLRHFANGISTISRWTEKEFKNTEKLVVPAKYPRNIEQKDC